MQSNITTDYVTAILHSLTYSKKVKDKLQLMALILYGALESFHATTQINSQDQQSFSVDLDDLHRVPFGHTLIRITPDDNCLFGAVIKHLSIATASNPEVRTVLAEKGINLKLPVTGSKLNELVIACVKSA